MLEGLTTKLVFSLCCLGTCTLAITILKHPYFVKNPHTLTEEPNFLCQCASVKGCYILLARFIFLPHKICVNVNDPCSSSKIAAGFEVVCYDL